VDTHVTSKDGKRLICIERETTFLVNSDSENTLGLVCPDCFSTANLPKKGTNYNTILVCLLARFFRQGSSRQTQNLQFLSQESDYNAEKFRILSRRMSSIWRMEFSW